MINIHNIKKTGGIKYLLTIWSFEKDDNDLSVEEFKTSNESPLDLNINK